MSESMELAAEKLSQKYQGAEESYKTHYIDMMGSLVRNYQEEIKEYQNKTAEADKQYEEHLEEINLKYEEAQAKLDEMKHIVAQAIAANKRAEEQRTQVDFYRLQLSDADVQEIEKLRQVEPYLRNQEPLNKVIWKVYYENPTTDLIGRVVGSSPRTGIYKITEIVTGKCYIGQAKNLADRWRQHIRRGIGADTPTKNKLYPEMKKVGVENFTFEIIEDCEPEKLNEREDFWQEYFKAKEYGFSIK